VDAIQATPPPTDSSQVRQYFDLLHNTLKKNGLLLSHRRIYKCDEAFLTLDYSREKVLAAKGEKNVYRQTHGTTDHITMLCCCSAAGIPHPPMIIYAKSFPVALIALTVLMIHYTQ